MKKIVICLGLLLISEAAFAARATVYNNMTDEAAIIMYSANNTHQKKRIPAGHEYTFNNRLAVAFTHMYVAKSANGKLVAVYYPTPSSTTMLRGSINIGPSLDECAVNFDKSGASSDNVHTVSKGGDILSYRFTDDWDNAKEGSGSTKPQE